MQDKKQLINALCEEASRCKAVMFSVHSCTTIGRSAGNDDRAIRVTVDATT